MLKKRKEEVKHKGRSGRAKASRVALVMS